MFLEKFIEFSIHNAKSTRDVKFKYDSNTNNKDWERSLILLSIAELMASPLELGNHFLLIVVCRFSLVFNGIKWWKIKVKRKEIKK